MWVTEEVLTGGLGGIAAGVKCGVECRIRRKNTFILKCCYLRIDLFFGYSDYVARVLRAF